MAASATLALKAGVWFRRGLLLMVSPVRGYHRRYQAETPLIGLFKFASPALRCGTRPPSPRTVTGCRTATGFMTKLLNHPQVKPLLSDEHFSVDGTLIEAWASQKSFRPKDGSGDDDDGANFHGQKRKNDTHASTSDPNSRLYRKAAGREAKLCYMGHATMENRHGLAVAGMVTHANGTAERRASEVMLQARSKDAGHRITVGEDTE